MGRGVRCEVRGARERDDGCRWLLLVLQDSRRNQMGKWEEGKTRIGLDGPLITYLGTCRY